MTYIDLLDSVKTAHPKSKSLEWWHPQTEFDQTASVAIAQTNIMMRLLMERLSLWQITRWLILMPGFL